MTEADQMVAFAFALISALTTAGAHSVLKAGSDRLAMRAVIGLTGLAAMAIPAISLPLPSLGLWRWLTFAAVLHATYQLVLIESYRLTDFSLAFPIARGIAPAGTAIGAFLILGERPTTAALWGIVAVCCGIGLIAAGPRLTPRGLVLACLTGFMTALYTMVDARGVRSAGSALQFISWFFVLDGIVMSAVLVLLRSRQSMTLLRNHLRQGVPAGVLSLIAFGSALLALRFGGVGEVAALRETSVLASVVIGWRFLAEPLPRRKLGGAAAITLGAALIIGSA